VDDLHRRCWFNIGFAVIGADGSPMSGGSLFGFCSGLTSITKHLFFNIIISFLILLHFRAEGNSNAPNSQSANVMRHPIGAFRSSLVFDKIYYQMHSDFSTDCIKFDKIFSIF